jgi:hypothetical protein
MSKSLKDQLMALGLASEKLARENKPREGKTGGHKTRENNPPGYKPHETKPRENRPHESRAHESRPHESRLRKGQTRGAKSGSAPDGAAPAKMNPLSGDFSLEAAYRLREQQTRQQAEAAREKKRQLDLERRRLNDAIRDIIMPRRLNDETAELTRNFLYRGRIRKVRVNPDQLKGLNEGTLGLVYLSGGYHILASEWVKVVGELSQDHVPDLSGGAGEHSSEDGEFPVPDDLVW